jgi:ATP-binding cassette, subfamily C (CFTR/MRP), member 1
MTLSLQITRSWYEHLGYRAMTMLRGGMISMIYDKMMELPVGNVNESGAMSVMGSDVETLADSFFMLICNTWANCIQVAIAISLLANQLGAVCVAPIIVAVGK